MTEQIVPIVLSGGMGSRLWPASRKRQPKQLLALVDDRSMLATTMHRAAALPATTATIVVAGADQRAGIQRELAAAGLTDARLILEPVGRNTAPAAAVAALDVTGSGDDPLLLVLPADHVITDHEAFAGAVAVAARLAANGYLVTFGIMPTHPETGYGYIEVGDALAEGGSTVVVFREKPDADTASSYVQGGQHLWNSGMFLFRAGRYLDELERHRPDVLSSAREALLGAKEEDDLVILDEAALREAPSISIDYAVMEPTDQAAVVPLDAGWSDVGSWEAMWTLGEADAAGNVVTGDAELLDVTNSLVRGGNRLIAAIGLDNVAIVDSDDATLVTALDRVQEVKDIVDVLIAQDRREVETDGSESRPWGACITLLDAPEFWVMRLLIDPGAKTSLQTHADRAEYWIVVNGVARMSVGETTRHVSAGDSVYVPAGEAHRLENASTEDPLEVIEVDV